MFTLESAEIYEHNKEREQQHHAEARVACVCDLLNCADKRCALFLRIRSKGAEGRVCHFPGPASVHRVGAIDTADARRAVSTWFLKVAGAAEVKCESSTTTFCAWVVVVVGALGPALFRCFFRQVQNKKAKTGCLKRVRPKPANIG